MTPSDIHARPYRDREDYQLARALLADVCLSTQRDGDTEPALSRLRRTAVALPGLFLPSRRPLPTQDVAASRRGLLHDLGDALDEASDSGALDAECVRRLAAKQKTLLRQLELTEQPT